MYSATQSATTVPALFDSGSGWTEARGRVSKVRYGCTPTASCADPADDPLYTAQPPLTGHDATVSRQRDTRTDSRANVRVSFCGAAPGTAGGGTCSSWHGCDRSRPTAANAGAADQQRPCSPPVGPCCRADKHRGGQRGRRRCRRRWCRPPCRACQSVRVGAPAWRRCVRHGSRGDVPSYRRSSRSGHSCSVVVRRREASEFNCSERKVHGEPHWEGQLVRCTQTF